MLGFFWRVSGKAIVINFKNQNNSIHIQHILALHPLVVLDSNESALDAYIIYFQ